MPAINVIGGRPITTKPPSKLAFAVPWLPARTMRSDTVLTMHPIALTLIMHQARAVTNLERVGRVGRGGGASTGAGDPNGFMGEKEFACGLMADRREAYRKEPPPGMGHSESGSGLNWRGQPSTIDPERERAASLHT